MIKLIVVLARNIKWKMKMIQPLYRQHVTLEHDNILLSCWVCDMLTQSLVLPGFGDPFFLSFEYSILSSWPLVLCWIKCYHTPNSCRRCSREVQSAVNYLYTVWVAITVLTIIIHFIPFFKLMMGDSSFPSFDGHFLLALAHYPGRLLRNSL